jgi:hypothetical protein
MDTKIKIMFFSSNPDNVNQLHLDEEIRSIKEKIRGSEHRDRLDLISAWAVRPDDLLQELNEHKPTIVHFAGHGNEYGELILMNDMRQAITVSPSTLKALFSTLKDNIRLVVLNACYSRKQAIAIARVIDCVVGMNMAISDEAAINFAASFYRAIGFGRSVKEAFEQGKVSIMFDSNTEKNTPKLLSRVGVDPANIFPLVNEITTTYAINPTETKGIHQWKVNVFNFENYGEIAKLDHIGQRFSELILDALIRLQINANQIDKEPPILPIRGFVLENYDWEKFVNLMPFFAIVGYVVNPKDDIVSGSIRVARVTSGSRAITVMENELNFGYTPKEMREAAQSVAEKIREVILT